MRVTGGGVSKLPDTGSGRRDVSGEDGETGCYIPKAEDKEMGLDGRDGEGWGAFVYKLLHTGG